MAKKDDNFLLNFGVIFIVICISFYILHIGASFIIPFILSILFAFALLAVSGFYKKILKLNTFFAMFLSFLTYIFIFFIIGIIISSNTNQLINKVNELTSLFPIFQQKISYFLGESLNFFKIESSNEFVKTLFGGVNFSQTITNIISSLTSVLSDAGLIFFYTMFILLEARNFSLKWIVMFPDKSRRDHISETINKIKSDIKSYFFIKTEVSFLVALLSYVIMLIFGLDLSMFWGLLVFLLNFIPFIGSIIAVSFPGILSYIQADFTIYTSTTMLSLLILAQAFVGNVIEPRLMGNRLNLSPLVIIVSLSFWGIIWGFWGMVLSIPIMVTINIILSRIPETRSIAMLLSEKGDLQIDAIKKSKKKKKFLNF